MKILLLSFNYGESSSPRAIRWNSLGQKITEFGHNLTVIHAGKNENIASQDTYCTHTLPLNPSSDSGKVEKCNGILGWIKSRLRNLCITLRWPDYGIVWVVKSLPILKSLMGKNDYDLIISVSHPFSSHLLGLYAKKKANEKCHWHVDIGDPFFLLKDIKVNSFFYSKLNFIAEHLVLKLADKIFVTNNMMKGEYLSEFKLSDEKVNVLFPIRNNPPFKYAFNPSGEVVYAGRFYSKVREPSYVIQLLSIVNSYNDDYKCSIYGVDCNTLISVFQLDTNLLANISINGMIPKNQLDIKISAASIIVNLGNTTDNQLPSKISDLIFSGKPVINIYQSENDACLELLKNHPACLSLNSLEVNTKETKQKVFNFIKMVESTDFSEAYDDYVSMMLPLFDAQSITVEYISNES
ncbi:TPR/glycosyl transferase domain protein [Photobacterium marinum]|uniref:TPR/glycosyl transferase domain protein n=1 Tax=Photobacterium marinum TaxID=1056511 RepID=L8J6H8_9GAMM|nr:hypothetical protein [Photobacterium marinum]ELR63773.1 TPR/glycosyl transferase domain protein [Photobacterium marinum]